jgi:hypothetical protein
VTTPSMRTHVVIRTYGPGKVPPMLDVLADIWADVHPELVDNPSAEALDLSVPALRRADGAGRDDWWMCATARPARRGLTTQSWHASSSHSSGWGAVGCAVQGRCGVWRGVRELLREFVLALLAPVLPEVGLTGLVVGGTLGSSRRGQVRPRSRPAALRLIAATPRGGTRPGQPPRTSWPVPPCGFVRARVTQGVGRMRRFVPSVGAAVHIIAIVRRR